MANSEDAAALEPGYELPDGARNDLLWSAHLLARHARLENLRFFAAPGLSFTPAEVAHVRSTPENGDWKYEVRANVGGLDGTSGPLPLWLNEILSREEPGEAPAGDFLNIFSHRFIESLYLAWAGQSPALAFEPGGRDRISGILFCLLGLHFPESETPSEDDDDFRLSRLLAYIGTMGRRSRSAVGLRGMLRDYFDGIPLEVEQFVPRRVTIPEAERSRLGRVGMTLGGDFVPGEQVEDIAGAFRIAIGPLDMADFSDFLPGGTRYRHLSRIVKMYVSHLMAWDMALRVTGESVPPMRLGEEAEGLRLGRSTWIRSAWYELTPRVRDMLRGLGVPPETIRDLPREFGSKTEMEESLGRLLPSASAEDAIPAILRAAYRVAPKENDEILFHPES